MGFDSVESFLKNVPKAKKIEFTPGRGDAVSSLLFDSVLLEKGLLDFWFARRVVPSEGTSILVRPRGVLRFMRLANEGCISVQFRFLAFRRKDRIEKPFLILEPGLGVGFHNLSPCFVEVTLPYGMCGFGSIFLAAVEYLCDLSGNANVWRDGDREDGEEEETA